MGDLAADQGVKELLRLHVVVVVVAVALASHKQPCELLTYLQLSASELVLAARAGLLSPLLTRTVVLALLEDHHDSAPHR